MAEFNPAFLVVAKEGTFKVPSGMKAYLEKHMKRCLSKEEQEAMFKEHPRPDLSGASLGGQIHGRLSGQAPAQRPGRRFVSNLGSSPHY